MKPVEFIHIFYTGAQKNTEMKEFSEKELLSMEKEMLGIYISGHPLEKYRKQIEETSTINICMSEKKSDKNQSSDHC